MHKMAVGATVMQFIWYGEVGSDGVKVSLHTQECIYLSVFLQAHFLSSFKSSSAS